MFEGQHYMTLNFSVVFEFRAGVNWGGVSIMLFFDFLRIYIHIYTRTITTVMSLHFLRGFAS